MTRERPVLMSGPMVRAILDGRKSVTRRVVKPQPPHAGRWKYPFIDKGALYFNDEPRTTFGFPALNAYWRLPYGSPGDRLWVRETWYCDDYRVQEGPYLEADGSRDLLYYRATDEAPSGGTWTGFSGETMHNPWRPSIHMPRWASRISLEVTEVRVERLQEITKDDACAEGVVGTDFSGTLNGKPATGVIFDPLMAFRATWDSLNAARGYGWDANPWVWVIRFRRLMP